MDKITLLKLKTSVDAGIIKNIARDWSEYGNRTRLVVSEIETVYGQTIADKIADAGYRGDVDTVSYMYERLVWRLAPLVDGMAYYAITGDPTKIKDGDYDLSNPAKFWLNSLDSIGSSINKQQIHDCLKDMHDSLCDLDDWKEIDMFAVKALKNILKMPKDI